MQSGRNLRALEECEEERYCAEDNGVYDHGSTEPFVQPRWEYPLITSALTQHIEA
jgi:hypothetical protein